MKHMKSPRLIGHYSPLTIMLIVVLSVCPSDAATVTLYVNCALKSLN